MTQKFKETEIGMIPENWDLKEIGEIAEFRQGLQIAKSQRKSEFLGNSYPLLKITDMGTNNFSEYIADPPTKYVTSNEDIIFTRTGQVGLVYTNLVGVLHNNCFKIITDPRQIDRHFLFYYLKSKYVQNFVNGCLASSVQSDLTHRQFKRCHMIIPPLEEQKSIGNTLLLLDQKIELNRQMNFTLEQIAQTLFKHWFIDFEFPDENGNPYKSSGGRMIDSELGEIPEGWKVVDLKEMSKIISKGTTPSKKQIADAEGAPSVSFIKVKDIADDGQINREGLELIHESIHKSVLKRSILFENDLLFSIAGTIGRVSIVENDLHSSNTNQAIAFIRLSEQKYLSLVLEHLKSKRIQEYAMTSIVQGVQANISLATVGSFQIVVPNDSILTAWNKVALSLHNEKLGRQKQNRLLSQLRDILLPKLMSGKIRVEC